MKNDRFGDGMVIDYPYLWAWQADRGQVEGDKFRPACLAAVIHDPSQDLNHLVILAISASAPKGDQLAIEIPALELRRAGLGDHVRGWITVSEYNYDVLERSFYFEPGQAPRGQFTKKFMGRIARALRPLFSIKSGMIDRTRG
ncbi:MAG: hypothetical protein HYS06_03520 [Methylocystis sp.]|nr:hypothetical protein [Methylocystis sp.]